MIVDYGESKNEYADNSFGLKNSKYENFQMTKSTF